MAGRLRQPDSACSGVDNCCPQFGLHHRASLCGTTYRANGSAFAFAEKLPAYPELASFVQPALDYDKIQERLAKATVICAQNDPIAPYQDGVAVAHGIGAKLIVQNTGGHFLTSDGYRSFPLALKELRQLVQ